MCYTAKETGSTKCKFHLPSFIRLILISENKACITGKNRVGIRDEFQALFSCSFWKGWYNLSQTPNCPSFDSHIQTMYLDLIRQ